MQTPIGDPNCFEKMWQWINGSGRRKPENTQMPNFARTRME